MKLIFLSHMFPNSKSPLTTPFMPERAKALSNFVDLDVVAPVSYFPFFKNNLPPVKEMFYGLNVFHPRYLGMPSFLWHLRWISYGLACRLFWRNRPPVCDLIHMEWIYPDAYAFLNYARCFKMKTVGVIHGNEAIGYFEGANHRKYYKKALQALDRIIAVSADLKRKMMVEYDVPEYKIKVIPNGVDLSKFPVIERSKAREALGLPLGRLMGVCVARLSDEKNLDYLVNAISLLGDAAPTIYIIGEGPLKNKLNQLINQFGVGEKVILAGPVPHKEIVNWLNAADFFCLPSQREGCPVVIHEALACGVPVVATHVGAVPDLIKSDDYGILCPPSDANALSDAISRAIKKPWDREKISSHGRKFTWAEVAKKTFDVFQEIIGQG